MYYYGCQPICDRCIHQHPLKHAGHPNPCTRVHWKMEDGRSRKHRPNLHGPEMCDEFQEKEYVEAT